MPYSGQNVIAVPGTLYAAPLNTTEPTSVTGAWPSGWIALGYTMQGSQMNIKPTTAAITPEEQYTPLRNVVTQMEYSITFDLWELTAQNWQLALNNGFTSAAALSDGTFKLAPAVIGTEIRVMLGWDSLTDGTTAGTVGGRLIIRQAFQTGSISISRRKGTNVAALSLTFSAEQPNPNIPAVDIFVPSFMAS
jgi:hypothetical protein